MVSSIRGEPASIANHSDRGILGFGARYVPNRMRLIWFRSLGKGCVEVENKLEAMYNAHEIFPSAHTYCIFSFQNIRKKEER